MVSVTINDSNSLLGSSHKSSEKQHGDGQPNTAHISNHSNGSTFKGDVGRHGLLTRLILVLVLGLLIFGAIILVSTSGLHFLNTQLQNLSRETLPASSAAYEMEINLLGSGLGVLKYLLQPDAIHRARFEEDRGEFQQFQEQFEALAKNTKSKEEALQAEKLYAEFVLVSERLIVGQDELRAEFDRLILTTKSLNKRIDGMHIIDPDPVEARPQLRSDVNELVLQLAVYIQLGHPESLRLLN